MKIIVMPRKAAENTVTGKSKSEIIVISIYSSGDPPADIKCSEKICRLNFDDVSSDTVPGTVPFNKGFADKIIDFMDENLDAKYLLVHCDAGISRSPAVATAIAEFYFNDHEFHLHHPCYNRMVYHILRYRMEERKENECQA